MKGFVFFISFGKDNKVCFFNVDFEFPLVKKFKKELGIGLQFGDCKLFA